MKNVSLNIGLFTFGYGAYSAIELAWRRYTHFTMGIAGGICFTSLYHIYSKLKSASLFRKCLIGALVITAVEFGFGVILNLGLRLNIWDYSGMPLNILGQVCPLYSFLWLLLCIPIAKLVDLVNKIYARI